MKNIFIACGLLISAYCSNLNCVRISGDSIIRLSQAENCQHVFSYHGQVTPFVMPERMCVGNSSLSESYGSSFDIPEADVRRIMEYQPPSYIESKADRFAAARQKTAMLHHCSKTRKCSDRVAYSGAWSILHDLLSQISCSDVLYAHLGGASCSAENAEFTKDLLRFEALLVAYSNSVYPGCELWTLRETASQLSHRAPTAFLKKYFEKINNRIENNGLSQESATSLFEKIKKVVEREQKKK